MDLSQVDRSAPRASSAKLSTRSTRIPQVRRSCGVGGLGDGKFAGVAGGAGSETASSPELRGELGGRPQVRRSCVGRGARTESAADGVVDQSAAAGRKFGEVV